MKHKYALGYVIGDYGTSLWIDSLVNIMLRDYPPVVRVFSGSPVHGARNRLSKGFLEDADADWLVMVDTDIIFTPEQVDMLLAHDDHPIVSGIYGTISPWAGEAEIILDGCGFMAVKREVLEALMPYPFAPMVINDGETSGEDVGFRIRARRAGFDTFIDERIKVKHVKTILLTLPEDVEAGVEQDRYKAYLETDNPDIQMVVKENDR